MRKRTHIHPPARPTEVIHIFLSSTKQLLTNHLSFPEKFSVFFERFGFERIYLRVVSTDLGKSVIVCSSYGLLGVRSQSRLPIRVAAFVFLAAPMQPRRQYAFCP